MSSMTCANTACRSALDEGDTFCRRCGTPVPGGLLRILLVILSGQQFTAVTGWHQ